MSLRIAESFYSIQGEGTSVGVPAYFIRLQNCNLMCGGPGGSLMKEGKATWWCDSEVIWKRGTETTFDTLVTAFKDQGLQDNILGGAIHLVWTGGEPTMPRNQKGIVAFLEHMDKEFPGHKIYNEIETNGTIVVEPGFYGYMDQINCSPKLANSGMTESMRIVPEAIKQILVHQQGFFKFVISVEADIMEIRNEFIIPQNIPQDRIIIMPGVDNRRDLPERTRFLFEMTKKYGYRGVTRQHILAWDKCVSV